MFSRPMSTSVKSELSIILVARGRNVVPGSLRCCFSKAPQSSIHLWGAIALLSSSKSLMSDMGKLGRKRVLSMHTRWSAATQTTRFRVLNWRALQVLITMLYWFEQRKLLMSTYLTQCQNIGRMQKHADTDLYIQANLCERQWGHLSHRQKFVTRISNRGVPVYSKQAQETSMWRGMAALWRVTDISSKLSTIPGPWARVWSLGHFNSEIGLNAKSHNNIWLNIIWRR